MDAESWKTLMTALISVGLILFGWLLGQVTEFLRRSWQNRRLKDALGIELKYLSSALDALRNHLIHRLRAHAVGYIETDEPIPLNNRIFSDKYSEINLKLNPNQRLSYENIHAVVKIANKRLEMISEFVNKAIDSGETKDLEKLGQLLVSQFVNVEMLRWRIGYHVRNPSTPAWETNDQAIKEQAIAHRTAEEQITRLHKEWSEGTVQDYLRDKEFSFNIKTMP